MNAERRGFLKLFGAGVAGIALEQAIPFNRVWSFPKKIVIAKPPSPGDIITIAGVNAVNPEPRMSALFEIGDIVSFPAFGLERYIVTRVSEDEVAISNVDYSKGGIVCGRAIRGLQRSFGVGNSPLIHYL